MPREIDGVTWYQAANIAWGYGTHTELLVSEDTTQFRVQWSG